MDSEAAKRIIESNSLLRSMPNQEQYQSTAEGVSSLNPAPKVTGIPASMPALSVVKIPSGGNILVGGKAPSDIPTDTGAKEARIGDYTYQDGKYRLVENSPTDYTLKRLAVAGVDEGMSPSLAPSAALGAVIGGGLGLALPGVGNLLGIGVGALLGGVLGAIHSVEDAAKEWGKQKVTVYNPVKFKVDSDGNVKADIDYSKMAYGGYLSGEETKRLQNVETKVEMGDDNRLKVQVSPIFANTDYYKDIIDTVSKEYAGLTKDSPNYTEAMQAITDRIKGAASSYQWELSRSADIATKFTGASGLTTTMAAYTELGGYLEPEKMKDYTIYVSRDGKTVEANAGEIIDSVNNMTKEDRSHYVGDLRSSFSNQDLPDEERALKYAEYQMLFAASNQKDTKYSGMLDQDAWSSLIYNFSPFGIDFANIFGIDQAELQSNEMLQAGGILLSGGIQLAVTAGFGEMFMAVSKHAPLLNKLYDLSLQGSWGGGTSWWALQAGEGTGQLVKASAATLALNGIESGILNAAMMGARGASGVEVSVGDYFKEWGIDLGASLIMQFATTAQYVAKTAGQTKDILLDVQGNPIMIDENGAPLYTYNEVVAFDPEAQAAILKDIPVDEHAKLGKWNVAKDADGNILGYFSTTTGGTYYTLNNEVYIAKNGEFVKISGSKPLNTGTTFDNDIDLDIDMEEPIVTPYEARGNTPLVSPEGGVVEGVVLSEKSSSISPVKQKYTKVGAAELGLEMGTVAPVESRLLESASATSTAIKIANGELGRTALGKKISKTIATTGRAIGRNLYDVNYDVVREVAAYYSRHPNTAVADETMQLLSNSSGMVSSEFELMTRFNSDIRPVYDQFMDLSEQAIKQKAVPVALAKMQMARAINMDADLGEGVTTWQDLVQKKNGKYLTNQTAEVEQVADTLVETAYTLMNMTNEYLQNRGYADVKALKKLSETTASKNNQYFPLFGKPEKKFHLFDQYSAAKRYNRESKVWEDNDWVIDVNDYQDPYTAYMSYTNSQLSNVVKNRLSERLSQVFADWGVSPVLQPTTTEKERMLKAISNRKTCDNHLDKIEKKIQAEYDALPDQDGYVEMQAQILKDNSVPKIVEDIVTAVENNDISKLNPDKTVEPPVEVFDESIDIKTIMPKKPGKYDDNLAEQRISAVLDHKLPITEYLNYQKELLWQGLQNSNRGTETFLTGLDQWDSNGNPVEVQRHTVSDNGPLYRELYKDFGAKPTKEYFFGIIDDVLRNGIDSYWHDLMTTLDPNHPAFSDNAGSDSIDDIFSLVEYTSSPEYLSEQATIESSSQPSKPGNNVADILEEGAKQFKKAMSKSIRQMNKYNKKFGVEFDVPVYIKNTLTPAIADCLNSDNIEEALSAIAAQTLQEVAPFVPKEALQKSMQERAAVESREWLEEHLKIRKGGNIISGRKLPRKAIIGNYLKNRNSEASSTLQAGASAIAMNIGDQGKEFNYWDGDGNLISMRVKARNKHEQQALDRAIEISMDDRVVLERGVLSSISRGAANIVRFANTGWNPVAPVRNFVRDSSTSFINMGGMLTSKRAARAFFADIMQQASQMGWTEADIAYAQDMFNHILNTRVDAGEMMTARGGSSAKNSLVRHQIEKRAKTSVGRDLKLFTYNLTHEPGAAFAMLGDIGENYHRQLNGGQAFVVSLANSVRMGVSFEEAIRNAMNASMFATSEGTTNFARKGTAINIISKGAPYVSAPFAGTSSAVISFFRDPKGVAGAWASYVLAYMFLLADALSNEKRRGRYASLTEYQRSHNIIIAISDDVFIKVPIEETLASPLFPYRAFLETLSNTDPVSFYQFLFGCLTEPSGFDFSGFMEGDTFNFRRGMEKLMDANLPSLITLGLESATGYDMYYGTNYKVDDKMLRERYNIVADSAGDYTTTGNDSWLLRHVADFTGMPQWRLQRIVSAIGGSTGQYVLSTIDKLAGASSEQQGGKEMLNDLTNTFLAMDSNVASSKFYDGLNALQEEKERVKYKLVGINQKLETASGQEQHDLEQKYQDTINEFVIKAGDFLNQYINIYRVTGGITKSQAYQILYLFDFSDDQGVARSGSVEDYNKGLAENEAYKSAVSSAATVLDKYYDQGGKIYQAADGTFKFYSPFGEQAYYNTIYGQGKKHLVNLTNIIEAKDSTIKSDYSKAGEARSAAIQAKDYDKYDAIALEYDKKLFNTILPYIKTYGADTVLNNSEVINYLKKYVYVPSSYMTTKAGRYTPALAHDAKKQEAYKEPFIKEAFGLSTAYKEYEPSSRPDRTIKKIGE